MNKLFFILLITFSCKVKEVAVVPDCVPSKECELFFTIKNSNQVVEPFFIVRLLPIQGVGADTDFYGKANFVIKRPEDNKIKLYINQFTFGDSLTIQLENCKSIYHFDYTIHQWVSDSINNMPTIIMPQIRYQYSEDGCRPVLVK